MYCTPDALTPSPPAFPPSPMSPLLPPTCLLLPCCWPLVPIMWGRIPAPLTGALSTCPAKLQFAACISIQLLSIYNRYLFSLLGPRSILQHDFHRNCTVSRCCMPQFLASCYQYFIPQVLAALRARGSEVDAGLPQQAMQAEMAAFLVILH